MGRSSLRSMVTTRTPVSFMAWTYSTAKIRVWVRLESRVGVGICVLIGLG
jgi:hypothetical protein